MALAGKRRHEHPPAVRLPDASPIGKRIDSLPFERRNRRVALRSVPAVRVSRIDSVKPAGGTLCSADGARPSRKAKTTKTR